MRQRIYDAAILGRCTHLEREGIHIRAQAHGISASRLVIVAPLLWEIPIGVLTNTEAIEREERAIFYARRIENNVNQIAKRLNAPSGGILEQQIITTLHEVQATSIELKEAFRNGRRGHIL